MRDDWSQYIQTTARPRVRLGRVYPPSQPTLPFRGGKPFHLPPKRSALADGVALHVGPIQRPSSSCFLFSPSTSVQKYYFRYLIRLVLQSFCQLTTIPGSAKVYTRGYACEIRSKEPSLNETTVKRPILVNRRVVVDPHMLTWWVGRCRGGHRICRGGRV